MDQMPSYNLLQAIDPTKIRVPISERFAKLTLSSNKKQQQKCDVAERQEELKNQQEKRNSVTRNISKQFEDEKLGNKQNLQQNPLLRSESSKETACNNSGNEADLTMEPLEVTDDVDNHTQVEDDVDLLSQQIASMCVEPKVISLSSGSIGNLSLFTEITSSESQRSSTSEVNNVHIVHNIPINVREAVNEKTISLNLTSSSTNSNMLEKTYEMPKDEHEEYEDEEEEYTEDEPITISDSSESNYEQEQDIMSISSLPSTSLSLPSLVDDKAERVAAFLRDVSIERHAMIDQGQLAFHDTVDQILDNNEMNRIQENLAKSRQIATADTESMTPDADEKVTPQSCVERGQRLKNLEDPSETELHTPKSLNNEFNAKHLQRLANDDTLDNTNMTEAAEEHQIEKISEIVSNLKTPESCKRDEYKIANDETQCNTKYNFSEETPKILDNIKDQKSRRMIALETERNTDISFSRKSPTPTKHLDPCRLVNEDTVSNSIITDIEEVLTQKSAVYNSSQDYNTPDKNKTIYNSPISKHSTLQSSINSSNELNATAPEHSVTILETDDENVEQKLSEEVAHVEDNKLSNSFHREDSSDDSSEYDDGQMPQIQMAMGKINISAKINIKIRIPNNISTETSDDDDQNSEGDNQDNKEKSKESNQLPDVSNESNEERNVVVNDHSVDSNETHVESDSPQNLCHQKQLKPPVEEIASSPNKSADSVETVENEKFLTEAERLLNQLYGKSWQTPDVMRTLKRSSRTDDKTNKSKSSSGKKIDAKNSAEKKSNNKLTVEESVLGDFSMFRRNIVKTNLDSTRLATPQSMVEKKEAYTEPRNKRKHLAPREKTIANHLPQTEQKQLSRNRRRINNDRWRQLIDDSDSEGDNASDDEDADESWSKNASEIEDDNDSDSDFENSPVPKIRKRKNNTTKQKGRSEKSDYLTKVLNKSKKDEIVYLDLSKEEVEVQDEMPESPPANHDVTFASRLQDILESCRHKDKSKLISSNKKTKRKLFTPNFGDEGFEVASVIDNETKANENIAKTNESNDIYYGVLEDSMHCPFDSQCRPKVFDLVNKQLETVKLGKPIFQLTPPSKKKEPTTSTYKKRDETVTNDNGSTPHTKSDADTKFKTPLTVKAKGPTKIPKEVIQIVDHKYSFLKSLDVTVSKTLCHPDALHYRDNYRTKKEDLSKILYDLYNEKLFENKLNVPIKWNKKLLNTAGRCLNKKKLGVRSSVVELSDKVLTSADRLRCTLIHELCHAATWIFNGEGGHGSIWKEWARRANATFPEIPKIGVCHQYDIEYKYTYKCTLCGAKSHAHSKSKKVENIRCSYCHGAIEIFLNKKDKDGNVMPTPVKEPTGFAKFVKDNYKQFKRDDLKHADVMKLLSTKFASLKTASN